MERREIVGCESCGQVQECSAVPADCSAYCVRCGSRLAERRDAVLNRTLAFVVTGLILYVPANLYPAVTSTQLGKVADLTIWAGMIGLFQDGAWPVALVVMFASIFVPMTKLLGLLYLVLAHKAPRGRLSRTRMYWLISKIGKWSMLDVFVMSIMVAVVQFGRISTAEPGPGIMAFAAVVVATLCASISFDPKTIWAPTRGPSAA